MKSITKLALLSAIVLGAVFYPQTVSGAPAKDGGATFKDVEGKDWLLSEVRIGGRTTTIDRQNPIVNSIVGFYSIRFQDGRFTGMGAPNKYNGPYTVESNRILTVGNAASTMMASFIEPSGLKEQDFYNYLGATERWDLFQGRLELFSKDSRGNEVILTFVVDTTNRLISSDLELNIPSFGR